MIYQVEAVTDHAIITMGKEPHFRQAIISLHLAIEKQQIWNVPSIEAWSIAGRIKMDDFFVWPSTNR